MQYKAFTLTEYIAVYFGGSQRAFAKAQGVLPQQVTQWLSKNFIVVNHSLYSPRRDLSLLASQPTGKMRGSTMNEQRAIELLQAHVRDYARQRAKDVARGAETPRLAALLVQKYGKGVVDALAVVFDSARSADPVMAVVDEEVSRIDPLWQEHNRERWAGRPADVVAN